MTSEREAELSTWEARMASLAMCGIVDDFLVTMRLLLLGSLMMGFLTF